MCSRSVIIYTGKRQDAYCFFRMKSKHVYSSCEHFAATFSWDWMYAFIV